MKLGWGAAARRAVRTEVAATPPAAPAPTPPARPRFCVWRGPLASGAAFDADGVRSEDATLKYRDELTYWVGQQRGDSQRMFGGPFWDIFRGWQVARMQELATALGLPNVDQLKVWSAGRRAVEIGPGPFPSISLVPWTGAIAVDPLADGYSAEGLIPPDARGVTFLTCPGETIPLVSQWAHIVVAENCLDHVDDPERVLREVRRLLRPDGMLWILVDLMNYKDHMHPNPFSEESLRALLAKAGFKVAHGGVSDHKSHPQAYGEFRGLLTLA